MSYIVAVKRIITKPEVLELASTGGSLLVSREDSDTLDVVWSDGATETLFQLVGGELQTTTPSTAAMEKLISIADSLGATVVGEEDLIPIAGPIYRGVFAGRSTWLGWPLLVLVLGALLLWRW